MKIKKKRPGMAHLFNKQVMAVVVAQLVEQLLPTQEISGSNPIIGKLLYRTLFVSVNCIEKKKI